MRSTNGQIRNALRMLWLRSRERSEALKRDHYSCVRCGIHQSSSKSAPQKIEVHHKEGVGNWDAIIELIQKELLCDPDLLECLCPYCHRSETYGTG